MMNTPDNPALVLAGRREIAAFRGQRGVVLMIAQIVLVAMTLAGIALVRSVDTGNVIAANLGFRQSAINISDVATEVAVAKLPTLLISSKDDYYPSGCNATSSTVGCIYYPLIQPATSNGAPAINWSQVAALTTTDSATISSLPSGYSVHYVIERMCKAGSSLPVTDIQSNCYADQTNSNAGFSANKIRFTGNTGGVYYRVTIRTTGPRGTVTMNQVVLTVVG